MSFLRRILSSFFRRRTDWGNLPYGKPAQAEDDLARLNGER